MLGPREKLRDAPLLKESGIDADNFIHPKGQTEILEPVEPQGTLHRVKGSLRCNYLRSNEVRHPRGLRSGRENHVCHSRLRAARLISAT